MFVLSFRLILCVSYKPEMEYIQSNKNSCLLIFEWYCYLKHRQLADSSISWRCCDSSCKGRIRVLDSTATIIIPHSHLPDPAEIEKRKFRAALKERATMADETPRHAIFAVQKDINRETAANIHVYSTNKRLVNRVRQQNRPFMPEPATLKGFTIPTELQVCHSGETFLFHDSHVDDEQSFRLVSFEMISWSFQLCVITLKTKLIRRSN